jgi:hypothetical protein
LIYVGYCEEFISFSPTPAPTENPTQRLGSVKAGERCVIDSECETSTCGLDSAALNRRLACCSTCHKFSYFFSTYCTNLSIGTACIGDQQCANGKCKNNFFAPSSPGDCN